MNLKDLNGLLQPNIANVCIFLTNEPLCLILCNEMENSCLGGIFKRLRSNKLEAHTDIRHKTSKQGIFPTFKEHPFKMLVQKQRPVQLVIAL